MWLEEEWGCSDAYNFNNVLLAALASLAKPRHHGATSIPHMWLNLPSFPPLLTLSLIVLISTIRVMVMVQASRVQVEHFVEGKHSVIGFSNGPPEQQTENLLTFNFTCCCPCMLEHYLKIQIITGDHTNHTLCVSGCQKCEIYVLICSVCEFGKCHII